jgi:hypothetical protein
MKFPINENRNHEIELHRPIHDYNNILDQVNSSAIVSSCLMGIPSERYIEHDVKCESEFRACNVR